MLEAAVGILGTATLAVIGWAFNLSSKTAVLEQRHEDLLKLISIQFAEMNRRLERIEEKL